MFLLEVLYVGFVMLHHIADSYVFLSYSTTLWIIISHMRTFLGLPWQVPKNLNSTRL